MITFLTKSIIVPNDQLTIESLISRLAITKTLTEFYNLSMSANWVLSIRPVLGLYPFGNKDLLYFPPTSPLMNSPLKYCVH